MVSQIVREWLGVNSFVPETHAMLLELLEKLNKENVNSLTIIVMGKGGVGKSSTVNSLIGEKAVSVSPFQSEGTRAVMVSRSRPGFTLNIIDTPGLVEGGCINVMAFNNIKSFLLNKTIDILLYVDRLDAYRVDNLDREVVKAITDTFGKGIWNRALVVMTHAQFSPPDGLPYDEFVSKRSETLLKAVRVGAGLKKQEVEGSTIPVVLVENSGRCNKNEKDEKVLPYGTAWIPHVVEKITEVFLGGGNSIYVDQKLIEGPNPNAQWKFLIPVIAAVQYFFVIKPIEGRIRADIASERRKSWEYR